MLTLCVIAGFVFYQQLFATQNGITVVAVDPVLATEQELDLHKELAVKVFLAYDISIGQEGPLPTYYDYFDRFFGALPQPVGAFKKQENGESLFSFYDDHGVLLGGLYGKKIFGPNAVLGLKEGEHAQYIDCLYVLTDIQTKGIGTALTKAFSDHAKGAPIFLYVWAIHKSARRVYEKCGFKLVTDDLHPDGCATPAVHELLNWYLYEPKDFVVYRKN